MGAFGINVRSDLREVERYLNDVKGNRLQKAAGSALTKTARAVRKEADQQIRTKWALSSAVIKDNLIARRVNNRLAAEVVASGKPIALRDYQARQTMKGATFRIKKSGGRKTYIRQGRTGFILTRFGGNVFVRTEDDPPGPKKGAIKKVYGPSIPQYFVSRYIRERMEAIAREVWPRRFNEELNYQFNVHK